MPTINVAQAPVKAQILSADSAVTVLITADWPLFKQVTLVPVGLPISLMPNYPHSNQEKADEKNSKISALMILILMTPDIQEVSQITSRILMTADTTKPTQDTMT